MTSTNVLLTVAKRPAPGQTKTRLTPPLTPAQASALYECFLRDTVDLMQRTPQVQRAIAFLPAAERRYFASLAVGFDLLVQEGADLRIVFDANNSILLKNTLAADFTVADDTIWLDDAIFDLLA